MEKELFDKYYTKYEVAKNCYDVIQYMLNTSDIFYLEPSAGNGVFLDVIKKNIIGFDILPEDEANKIIKLDFLTSDIHEYLPSNKNIICIGNPPFGKKSNLAIQFINKCFNYSDIVAFILPIQFRKYSAQSKIIKEAELVLDLDLNRNSFIFNSKDYDLRCCFQIWCKPNSILLPYNNLRLLEKPITIHKDFDMYQYNRTKEAEKYFDYEWDFAVYRQGFLNYTYKAFNKNDCNKKHQYMFIKAHSKDILNKLLNIDFEKLSKQNCRIPGFGKADLVKEYNRKYGNGN